MTGCSGGNGGESADAVVSPTPPVVTSPTVAGTVAVGAPLTDGKLRIIDANGAVVAENIAIGADGRYSAVTLTGPAPYRLEACGFSGAEYQCIYSVATGAGTANVTPLTTAVLLLATGDAPDSLMVGSAPDLTTNNIDTAQTQLRAGLTDVLRDAGVPADLNFVTGALNAGSRAGYDRVLDSVGVTTGEDEHAFVQLTPRIGSGNLYLEQGNTSGTLSVDEGAANLDLSGIDTLFRNMTTAVASAEACGAESGGLRGSMASNARLSVGDVALRGPAQVAAGLCALFSGDLKEGSVPLFGAQLVSPVLGQCDLSGAAPLCQISFALRLGDDVQEISEGLGVTFENGAWKLFGTVADVHIRASARAQRDERIDGETPVVTYQRALAFEVPALPSTQCADVRQRDADGEWVRVALYKPHPGVDNLENLSVWRSNGSGDSRSFDPATGFTRGSDDSQISLPEGAEGDAFVRNFYRGGRMVRVSLYSDDACSIAATIEGSTASSFEVEIDGVPPVSSALAGLAWPEITAQTRSALQAFAQAAATEGTFTAAWTFRHGPLGMGDTLFCAAANQGDCGRDGAGRLGDHDLRPSATQNVLVVRTGVNAVAAGDTKLFALTGRLRDRLGLQANYSSCTDLPSGQSCASAQPMNQ